MRPLQLDIGSRKRARPFSHFVVFLAACGAAEPLPPARTTDQRAEDSAPAVSLLQTSKFDEAGRSASWALSQDPRNARAAAVHAIAIYRQAGNELILKMTNLLDTGIRGLDHERGRETWMTLLAKLDEVDRDLAVVAADPNFSLELCLACWEHDWNRNGQIDDRDRKMFEIEFDGQGGEIAESDPRRRPTYRFDVGDAEWARAMIAFQRAGVELILAYKWNELDKLFANLFSKPKGKMTIHLADKDRVRHARELILFGLDHAERCRSAYLAETDDDREWVPNPKQKNYAMPLEVDNELYDTWKGVLGDVRRMLESKEGISLREAQSVAEVDDITLPNAYLDLGAMLRDPKDIVLDFSKVDPKLDIEGVLQDLVGNGYRTKMKPSPIVSRLRKMKDQLSRGEDTFDRKLRYLMWLN
jgi:hypothetical protein